MDQDYLTEDELEAQRRIVLLNAQVERGAFFADWMRAPAGLLFLQMLEAQISDAKNSWLSATSRDAAEVVRVQSQVYLKIKQWLGAQVQAGRVAQQGLKQFQEEGVALSNIVRAPERPE